MGSISQLDLNDTTETDVPSISNLEELITHLREVFKSDHINTDYVEDLMKSYESNPLDWEKYAKFDAFKLTRNLVDEGNGKYNLIVVCWGGGHKSTLHDHADSHCFMKVLRGSLSEVRFEWPEGKEDQSKEDSQSMKEISRDFLPTNAISYMNDSLGLHRVENSSETETAVSLHLYSPGISTCSVFDQNTGQSMKCQVTFWTKYGQKA